MKVENVAEGDEAAEYALKVSAAGFAVERDLSAFNLRSSGILSFKAKAGREAVLRVTLVGKNGRRDFDVNVKRSDKREKYNVSFNNVSDIDKINAVAFEEAKPNTAPGAVWLDTIVFGTDFSLRRWIKFEAYKLIQVAVPMTLGLLALGASAVVLRVEEMGIIYTWLKDEGLAKIKEKLKGGKGRGGAGGGPKAPPMPDVET